MYVERHAVSVTTTSTGGAGTNYTPVVTGRVLAIQYVSDAGAAFASTAVFAVTAEQTGESLWAETVLASTVRYPRIATHTASGAANTAVDAIAVANDRVKIVVSSGGNSKTGLFNVIIG